MERSASPVSVAEAGDVPPAPDDSDIIACPTEDLAGNPIGYLIDWPTVTDSTWVEAMDDDSFVALDASR